MKLTSVMFTVAALAFAGLATAQTDCSSYPTLSSNQTISNLSTCDAPAATINGTTYTHVAAYKFVSNNATGTISVPNGGSLGVVVTTSCAQAGAIVSSNFAYSLNANLIPNGQTGYVYVLAADTADQQACFTTDLTVNGTLPVALQKFSVN